MQAAELGDADLIRVLGEHKIPFRTSDRNDRTPWQVAALLKVSPFINYSLSHLLQERQVP